MKRRYPALLTVVFLAVFLSVGVVSVRRNLYLQSSALTPASVGNLRLNEATDGVFTRLDIQIRIDSDSGKSEEVSTVAVRLSIPEGLTPVDAEGKKLTAVLPNEDLEDFWEFPVNSIQSGEGATTVDIAALYVNPLGFANSSYTTLASFYFKKEGAGDSGIEFDPDFTQIFSKRRPVTDVKYFSGK
jgi:hypothetical protein